MKNKVITLLAIFLFPSLGISTTMEKANEYYTLGDYSKSIDEYEKIVKEGFLDENLFYNLGNAYYRAKLLGPAIYNYERALRFEPSMNDAKINLAIAHRKVQETIDFQFEGAEKEPLSVRLALRWTHSSLVSVFFVFYFILFAGLFVLVLKPYSRMRFLWGVVVLLAFLGAVFFGFLWNRQVSVLNKRHQALVIVDSVDIREAPNARSTDRGELYPGIRVRILEIENTWAVSYTHLTLPTICSV